MLYAFAFAPLPSSSSSSAYVVCAYYMLNINAFQELHTRMLVYVKRQRIKMCLKRFPKKHERQVVIDDRALPLLRNRVRVSCRAMHAHLCYVPLSLSLSRL